MEVQHRLKHSNQKLISSVTVQSQKRGVKRLIDIPHATSGTLIDSCDPNSSAMDNVPLKDLFPNVKVRKRHVQERKVGNLESPSPKNQESQDSMSRLREERKAGNLESPSLKNQENLESTRNRLRDSLAAALRNAGDAEFNRSSESGKNMRGVLEEEARVEGIRYLAFASGQGRDEGLEQKLMNGADLERASTQGQLSGVDARYQVDASWQSFRQHECKAEMNGNLYNETSYLEESPFKKVRLEDENVRTEDTEAWQLLQQAENVAAKIEVDLFRLFGGVNRKYKEKARSLLFNLKDRSNPELRAQVLSGEITPESLCTMTAEQLASKELCQWRMAKAEELAHMVVLPDVETDARRLVKKTHKGEFEVQVEKDDTLLEVVAGGVRQLPMLEMSMEKVRNIQEKPQFGQGEFSPIRGSVPSVDISGEQHCSKFHELPDTVVLERERDNLLPRFIPSDDYVDFRKDEMEGFTMPEQERLKNILKHTETSVPMSDGNGLSDPLFARTQNLKGANKGSKIVDVLQLEKLECTENYEKLWEGSFQLSGSQISPVLACFISGERVDLISWPEVVEVKGRVRLDALDKFLQDLHLSRTRSVMIISCRMENQEENANSVSASREVANQYEKGKRVGFAEPALGFELYLFPPRGSALKLLSEHGYFDNIRYDDDDDHEILVGCVVWRRNQVSFNTAHKASSPQGSELVNVTQIAKVLENTSTGGVHLPSPPPPLPPPLPPPHVLLPSQVIQEESREEENDDIPPGFGPKATIFKPSMLSIPNIKTPAIQDDDDLPEFDFLSEKATRDLALKVSASITPVPLVLQGLHPQQQIPPLHPQQQIPPLHPQQQIPLLHPQQQIPPLHPQQVSPLYPQPQISPQQVPPFPPVLHIYEPNPQPNLGAFKQFNPNPHPHVSPLRRPPVMEGLPQQNFQTLPRWPRLPPPQPVGPQLGRPPGAIPLSPFLHVNQINNFIPNFNHRPHGQHGPLGVYPPRPPVVMPPSQHKIVLPTFNLFLPQDANRSSEVRASSLWDDDDMPEWYPPAFMQG